MYIFRNIHTDTQKAMNLREHKGGGTWESLEEEYIYIYSMCETVCVKMQLKLRIDVGETGEKINGREVVGRRTE